MGPDRGQMRGEPYDSSHGEDKATRTEPWKGGSVALSLRLSLSLSKF